MSSGYTIDIQLTELGFPDLFGNEETEAKETLPSITPAGVRYIPVTHLNAHISCPPPPNMHDYSSPESRAAPIMQSVAVGPRNNQQSGQSNPQTNNNPNIYISRCTDTLAVTCNRTHIDNSIANVNECDRGVVFISNFKQDVKATTSKTLSKHISNLNAIVTNMPIRIVRRDVNGDSKKQGAGENKKDNMKEAGEDSDEDDDEEEEEEEGGIEEPVASDTSTIGSSEHNCKVCNLTLPSAFRLQEHMHLHSGARPYCCAECGKQFCHLANYRVHLRSHAQALPIRCKVCKATFGSEESLLIHLKSSHLEEGLYQCDFCKRIFTCRKECQRHVSLQQCELKHHPCPHCERRFHSQKYLALHLQTHNCKRTFICTVCGRGFPKKNILLRHSFSHLGLLPYTCVRCRRHFRLASLYRKHLCKPERIQCVACLGFFHSEGDFQRHKEETGCWGHQEAKKDEIRCMECGQAFESVEELKKHGGAHQRVLTCSECGKGFRSAILLMSHMGGHASQRPCLCQRCGLGFPHQQAYDIHHKDCGRVPPVAVVAKKQKKSAKISQPMKAPVKLKQKKEPEGVWRLTLDKEPPPGTALFMFVPAPLGASLTKGPAGAILTAEGPPVAGCPVTQEKLPCRILGTSEVPRATVEMGLPESPVDRGTTQPSETREFSEPPNPMLIIDSPQLPAGAQSHEKTAPLIHTGDVFPVIDEAESRLDIAILERSGNDRNLITFTNKEGVGEVEVEEGLVERAGTGMVQQGDVLLRLKVECMPEVESVVAEQIEDKDIVISKEEGEMGKDVLLKVESSSPVYPDMALDLLKIKKEAYSTDTGWLGTEGTEVEPCYDLIPLKCAVGQGEGIGKKQEMDTHESLGCGVKVEGNKEMDTWAFDYVEVEIWDEEIEEQMEDEPHECINCGRILLDGDLIQHYMQHAMEFDSLLPDSSPRTRSLSFASSPPSPPRRKLRPRKKH